MKINSTICTDCGLVFVHRGYLKAMSKSKFLWHTTNSAATVRDDLD